MPPADEETEVGFRVLVKQSLKSINEKLDAITDHETRLRNLEKRALIAMGFALCLSSISAITTAVQLFVK
jgi:hypothetical protein